jgi:hypothetical protein
MAFAGLFNPVGTLCGLVTIKALGGRQLTSDQHHSI